MLSLDWIYLVNMQNWLSKRHFIYLIIVLVFWIGKQSRLVGHLTQLDSKWKYISFHTYVTMLCHV